MEKILKRQQSTCNRRSRFYRLKSHRITSAFGNNVTCLDNFSTGKRENLKGFTANSNFRLIEGDIRNMSDCENAVRDVDIVFHEAALGSVPRSIKDPVTYN